MWWLEEDEDRPSDTGILKLGSCPPGNAVSYYASRIFTPEGKHDTQRPTAAFWGVLSKVIVVSLAPIDADLEEEGAPVALDDVVTYSSRLILRARIPEEDTHLMFMYREHGTAYVPVGGMSFADNMALLELDPYDCAMVLAKRILERSKDSRDNEVQEAARRLLKSKPPFEDLKASAAAAYSTKQPTDEDLLYEFYQNRNSRIPVDPSAKVSESIKLLRGRRRCHMILLQRARSADDPSAKPAPPRGASEELPAVKPKGRRSSFIIFCDKQRPALEKKGMSPREIGAPTASKDRSLFFSRAKPPFSPQAENAASSGPC